MSMSTKLKYRVLEPISDGSKHLLESQEFLELGEKQEECQALVVRNRTKVDASWIERNSNLKYLIKPGTGLDNIDQKACAVRGIKVFNSPGANANGVAELALMLMLTGLRNAFAAEFRVKQTHTFNRTDLGGREMRDKTVGLVGVGSIGRQVVEYLAPFHCRILVYDVCRYEEWITDVNSRGVSVSYVDSLQELAQQCDIISLHLPLLESTRHIVNEELLKNAKPGLVLVNTSRGPIVDLNALKKSLDSGIVSFYASDVVDDETMMSELEMQLSDQDNVIFTPHIGAQTAASFNNMCVQAVESFINQVQ